MGSARRSDSSCLTVWFLSPLYWDCPPVTVVGESPEFQEPDTSFQLFSYLLVAVLYPSGILSAVLSYFYSSRAPGHRDPFFFFSTFLFFMNNDIILQKLLERKKGCGPCLALTTLAFHSHLQLPSDRVWLQLRDLHKSAARRPIGFDRRALRRLRSWKGGRRSAGMARRCSPLCL